MGLRVSKNEKISLIAANGEKMPVEGTAIISAEGNKTRATLDVIVSAAIQDDMLVSCSDLIKLRAIPEGFPNVQIVECRKALDREPKEILMEEFEDVLSDELNPEPMRTEAPMHISLMKGALPKKVTTARRVPLRYEREAEETVKELIAKGVITPANETTDWCSPAFFVPKGDKIRVRLVTDYTELNKHVKRPVHPFTHTKEILQAVPKEAKVFAKLDAVHGYFQLGLDEASSRLTTFLLPQGKFRYLRAPMGLNASSDEWCCQSDVIIRGIPWARKIVDDTLIWAENISELLDRTRIILERCRHSNITISKKKLELGSRINFTGHIISDKGIRPDDEKYKAVKEFPRPKNLKDLSLIHI